MTDTNIQKLQYQIRKSVINSMYGLDVKKSKDPEPRCPAIEECSHSIKKEQYEDTCINGCHKWGNCSYLPTEHRRRYRNKYYKKPKRWEVQEIAEKL